MISLVALRQNGGTHMQKGSVIKFILGLIAVVAALTAAVTAYFIYMDKKQRDEEELEHYLDCSIQ